MANTVDLGRVRRAVIGAILIIELALLCSPAIVGLFVLTGAIT